MAITFGSLNRLTAGDVSRAARRMYGQGSAVRRWMVRARPYICPFEEIIKQTPRGSTVLDVGCGDGLFLVTLADFGLISRGTGFDTSRVAIQSARLASGNLPASVALEFIHWSVEQPWPGGEFDVVSMIDVLHHIPPEAKRAAVEQAAAHVKPGGLFLFKDIGEEPRWRAFLNSLHDLILTGERVTYTPLNTLVSWVQGAGLVERERATINRLWYGHESVVFVKPA